MPIRIKVTLVRSPIGLEKSQRLTAEALGLRRLNRSRVHHNNPQIRGMIRKIGFLVSVEGEMACGIGACLGCAVPLTDGSKPFGYACTDGPVFDASRIVIP